MIGVVSCILWLLKMSDTVVEGLNDLLKKLHKIEAATAKKHLRSAAMFATGPTFRAMKAAAPRGTEAHRTYKGRLVAPGFLGRSVRRVTKFKGGKMRLMIGVRREALYGVTFLDEGTKKVAGRHWFKSRFESDADTIALRFRDKLKQRIEAVAR